MLIEGLSPCSSRLALAMPQGRSAQRLLCGVFVASCTFAARPTHGELCGFELETGIDWEAVRSSAWIVVEERSS